LQAWALMSVCLGLRAIVIRRIIQRLSTQLAVIV
jgi:hypothetical protein